MFFVHILPWTQSLMQRHYFKKCLKESVILSDLNRSNLWITKLMESMNKWPTTLSKLILTTSKLFQVSDSFSKFQLGGLCVLYIFISFDVFQTFLCLNLSTQHHVCFKDYLNVNMNFFAGTQVPRPPAFYELLLCKKGHAETKP